MEQVLWGISVLLKFTTLYFMCIAIFTVKKQKNWPEKEAKMNFAVIIAARNEEKVIGNLVESILAQNYPAHMRTVFVVPNNCTDQTEEAAVAAGAQIIRCFSPVKNKGEALRYAIGQLLHREFDAFVVFDADNIVHPDFLQRMNNAFCAGAKVCKGRQKVLNPLEGGVSGCYGLYFEAFDWFFNRPRAACGLSAKLVGTGFAVHREVFEQLGGWNTSTIAEDAEFAAQCARIGCRVWWVPDALTYDEAPTSFWVSLRQRRRWCSGVMQVGRQEWKQIWCGKSEYPKLRLDMTMFLLAPFTQAISALLLFGSLLMKGVGSFSYLPVGLAVGYGGMMLLAIGLCFLGRYGIKGMGRTVLLFPVFMASWLPLQVISLFKETKTWYAIAHKGNKDMVAVQK